MKLDCQCRLKCSVKQKTTIQWLRWSQTKIYFLCLLCFPLMLVDLFCEDALLPTDALYAAK